MIRRCGCCGTTFEAELATMAYFIAFCDGCRREPVDPLAGDEPTSVFASYEGEKGGA